MVESYVYPKSIKKSKIFGDGDSIVIHLGDNCIQNFHLGRYIVGYTDGNLVLG